MYDRDKASVNLPVRIASEWEPMENVTSCKYLVSLWPCSNLNWSEHVSNFTWLHYIMLNNFSPSGSVTYYAEPFFSYQECKNAWSAGSKVAVSDASISQFCKFKGNSPSPSSINSSLLSSAKEGCRSAWLYVALTFVTINRDHTLDIVYSRTPVLLGYVCLWL